MIEQDYDPDHTCVVLVSSDDCFATNLGRMRDRGCATSHCNLRLCIN